MKGFLRNETRVLAVADDAYPQQLREIPDHPPVLYVRGTLPSSRRCVACIGTRVPSVFGRAAARGIASFLAQRGWSIISGLARGVDTLCHEAALEAGGHTVAVLANGLDSVYPRENTALAERILDSGGALLSEQPFGTAATGRHLVRRNRLQSGMSVATIVMQTDLVGGSMHTAKYTLLQERLLVAPVPRGVHADVPKSRGILALTQKTGTDLYRILDARGEFATLLTSRFANCPAALALDGREAYPGLLIALETALATAPIVASQRSARPLQEGHVQLQLKELS